MREILKNYRKKSIDFEEQRFKGGQNEKQRFKGGQNFVIIFYFDKTS